MNLYIETENGNTKNHPAFEDNLIQAFGKVPDHWEKFVRVERPTTCSVYQIIAEFPEYQKIDGVWTDVWTIRDMTAKEKLDKQQSVKDMWLKRPNLENFSAWTFDEETCSYKPPIPRPDDGKSYQWDGKTNLWVEFTLPTD